MTNTDPDVDLVVRSRLKGLRLALGWSLESLTQDEDVVIEPIATHTPVGPSGD